jgi:hypothetical protein
MEENRCSSTGPAQRRNLVTPTRLVLMRGPVKIFTSTNLHDIGGAIQMADNHPLFGAPEGSLRHGVSPLVVAEMSQEDQKRPGLG